MPPSPIVTGWGRARHPSQATRDRLRAVAVLAVLATAATALATGASRWHPPQHNRRPVAPAPAVAAIPAAARRAVAPPGLPLPAESLLPPGVLRSALAALQAAYLAVVRQTEPEVVQITTAQDLGSGVVFDRGGDIVTNDHVVNGARAVTVTFSDGRVAPARVLATYRAEDLAVVRVNPKGLNLHPATLAPAGSAQPGAIVLAVGNPLGFQSSVTVGVVSALGRRVTEPNGVTLRNVVQTSAEINPGNSGGALVDIAGQVVGIPTLVALNQQSGGEASGIGFAIPSATVARVASDLIRSGRVPTVVPNLDGIAGGDVQNSLGQPLGVLVTAVRPGSPAAASGIRPQEIVVAVGGRPVGTVSAFARRLAAVRPGAQVHVTVLTPGGARRQLAWPRPAGRSA